MHVVADDLADMRDATFAIGGSFPSSFGDGTGYAALAEGNPPLSEALDMHAYGSEAWATAFVEGVDDEAGVGALLHDAEAEAKAEEEAR